MDIQQLSNKLFDGTFTRSKFLETLNKHVYTIEEITEYMNDVNTNKIFEEREFVKWVNLKRRVKK